MTKKASKKPTVEVSKKKKASKKKKRTVKLPSPALSPTITPAVLSTSDLELLEKRVYEASVPYNYDLASEIVERVYAGESLSQICRTPGMPKLSDCYKWLRDHELFRSEYELARSTEGLRAYEDLKMLSDSAVSASKDDVPGLKLSADIKKWISERTDRARYAPTLPREEGSGVVIQINTGIERDVRDTRSKYDLIDEVIDVSPKDN